MKNETCDMLINRFMGLKGNMYTYVKKDQHECKKPKGINNKVVKEKITSENYKNVLLNAAYTNHEMNRIQRKNHNIGTYRINKVSSFSYHDKNIYLKMDTVHYHLFINLLVNHAK